MAATISSWLAASAANKCQGPSAVKAHRRQSQKKSIAEKDIFLEILSFYHLRRPSQAFQYHFWPVFLSAALCYLLSLFSEAKFPPEQPGAVPGIVICICYPLSVWEHKARCPPRDSINGQHISIWSAYLTGQPWAQVSLGWNRAGGALRQGKGTKHFWGPSSKGCRAGVAAVNRAGNRDCGNRDRATSTCPEMLS